MLQLWDVFRLQFAFIFKEKVRWLWEAELYSIFGSRDIIGLVQLWFLLRIEQDTPHVKTSKKVNRLGACRQVICARLVTAQPRSSLFLFLLPLLLWDVVRTLVWTVCSFYDCIRGIVVLLKIALIWKWYLVPFFCRSKFCFGSVILMPPRRCSLLTSDRAWQVILWSVKSPFSILPTSAASPRPLNAEPGPRKCSLLMPCMLKTSRWWVGVRLCALPIDNGSYCSPCDSLEQRTRSSQSDRLKMKKVDVKKIDHRYLKIRSYSPFAPTELLENS